MEYTIGIGPVQALFRFKQVAIKVVQGEKEVLSIPVDRLPTRFVWDTAFVPDGHYQVRVMVTEKSGAETVVDYTRADVENGSRIPIAAAASAPPEPLPHPQWDKAILLTKLPKGDFTLPVTDWPSNAPATMVPMVYVLRDNVMVERIAAGPVAGQDGRRFEISARDWPDGSYRFVLMAVDLDSTREAACDEMTLTLGSDKKPLPGGGLMPIDPKKFIPRNAPADLEAFPMYDAGASSSEIETVKKKRFDWVFAVSRRAGDPHPEIAAAQFALESGWGEHLSGEYNIFGIKAKAGEPSTAKGTQEWDGSGQPYAITDYFKNFTSFYDAVIGRLAFLRSRRYLGYWTAHGSDSSMRALKDYCTDPDYRVQILSILQRKGRLVP